MTSTATTLWVSRGFILSATFSPLANAQPWRFIILAVFLVGLYGADAKAASFNCESALTQVEAMICKDDVLSEMDDKLAIRYREKLATVDDPNALLAEQRRWLRLRAACVDQHCVGDVYRERLRQLELAKSSVAQNRVHAIDFCSKAAQSFNENRLITILSSESRLNGPLRIDLNGDGRNEILEVMPEGRYEAASLSIRNDQGEEISLEYEDPILKGMGDGIASIVRIEKRLYEIRHDSGRLIALASFDKNFKGQVVCEFTLTKNSGVHLTKPLNRALTPFELITTRSQRKGLPDPYYYAVEAKDPSAVALLHDGGQPINPKPGEENDSPLAYAVWRYDDEDEAAYRVVEQMLKVGADPHESGKNLSALEKAFWLKKPRFAELLLRHSTEVNGKELSRLIDWVLPDEIKNRFLMRYAQLQGGIDFDIVFHALSKKNDRLLQQIAEATLPYLAAHEYYSNGQATNVPYWISIRMKRLDNDRLRIPLLSKKSVMRKQGSLGHSSEFARSGRFVLVKSGLGKQSSDISLAINVCLHLLGGDCGDEMTIKAARQWFDRLPSNCPDNAKRIYDDAVCRLAVEYARGDHTIFFGPDDTGALDFAKSIQMIGVRSIEKRAGWFR